MSSNEHGLFFECNGKSEVLVEQFNNGKQKQ